MMYVKTVQNLVLMSSKTGKEGDIGKKIKFWMDEALSSVLIPYTHAP